MPSDKDLEELNSELENAGLSPLGNVPGKEGDEDARGAGDDETKPEVVPKNEEPEEPEETDEPEEPEGVDEGDEDDEDDESGEGEPGEVEPGESRKQFSVPYTLYKDETRALKEERDFWQKKALEAQGGKPEGGEAEISIKDAAKNLAVEFGLNQVGTEKIVSTIVDLAAKRALPKDIMERLAKAEEAEKQRGLIDAQQAERSYFDNEWQEFLPTLQEKYPNATPQQLIQAKKAMDIIAHSTKFGRIPDLEYIFTKTEKDFEGILFSPKKKTFEQGRRGRGEEERGSELATPEIGRETPESIRELEDKIFGDEEGSGLEFYDGERKLN